MLARRPAVAVSSLTLEAHDGRARTGVLHTAHGEVRLPAFMPVGTHATVKALHPDEVRAAGVDMLLCNGYHLTLRPGLEVIEKHGGLHRMMGWDGPILTDSGGYQIVSLGGITSLDDTGATFVSPYDGARMRVTPEDAVVAQARMGTDVIMALDQPVTFGASPESTAVATRRTHIWAERCRAAHPGGSQLLFGIVQGGFDPKLRRESAHAIVSLGFDGVAIGGLALGEPPPIMEAMAGAALEALPDGLPRYVMGLGSDTEVLAMIAAGVDMFDCVLPTRLARTGTALTRQGRLSLRNSVYREDLRPLQPGCPCPACSGFTRAYLRHLVQAGELLAHRLLSLHNLTHLAGLLADARRAIAAGCLAELRRERLRELSCADERHRIATRSFISTPYTPKP